MGMFQTSTENAPDPMSRRLVADDSTSEDLFCTLEGTAARTVTLTLPMSALQEKIRQVSADIANIAALVRFVKQLWIECTV